MRTKFCPGFFIRRTFSHAIQFSLFVFQAKLAASKNRPPKAWQSHAMGSGGHQTDSKLASVLANKASIEVENRQNCLTHYGIKGIIASAFADLAK
ncbi:MAG: hypothetical protein ACLP2Y_06235 [Limisphaerales bacterium]